MGKIFADYVMDIQNRVRNQRVLDVGCLATARRNILKRHDQYGEFAREMIGVDYNEEFLKIARSKGRTNLHYLNLVDDYQVEKFIARFGTFDHVIATDVIEHVGNLTLFLDNIYRLLSGDGYLYLTTVNALCPRYIHYAMQNDGMTKVNPDHICWFDIQTLTSLLNRSNLQVRETMYQQAENVDSNMVMKIRPWMGKRIYVVAARVG